MKHKTVTAILDTSYILNNLDIFLASIDIQPSSNRLQLIIFFPVLQELDKLKLEEGETGFLAREFNRRLNYILSNSEKTPSGYQINENCYLVLKKNSNDILKNLSQMDLKSTDDLILNYAIDFKNIFGKYLNIVFLTDDVSFQNKAIVQGFNTQIQISLITEFVRNEAKAMNEVIDLLIISNPKGGDFTLARLNKLLWSNDHIYQYKQKSGKLYQQYLLDVDFIHNTSYYKKYSKLYLQYLDNFDYSQVYNKINVNKNHIFYGFWALIFVLIILMFYIQEWPNCCLVPILIIMIIGLLIKIYRYYFD